MPISYRIDNPEEKGHRGSVRVMSHSEPDATGLVPWANITVSPPEEVPNFSGRRLSHEYVDTHSVPVPGTFNPSTDRELPNDKRHPSELFTHISPQIKAAYSDPSLRHTLPTMVGMAMHALHAEGDKPMADNLLTKFSSSLSRNAVKRGLAVPHPQNVEMTPDSAGLSRTFPLQRTSPDRLMQSYGESIGYREARSDEVSTARSWVKGRLRSKGETQFPELADIPSESKQGWLNSAVKPVPGQMELFG
jgi:hypothetical protein